MGGLRWGIRKPMTSHCCVIVLVCGGEKWEEGGERKRKGKEGRKNREEEGRRDFRRRKREGVTMTLITKLYN